LLVEPFERFFRFPPFASPEQVKEPSDRAILHAFHLNRAAHMNELTRDEVKQRVDSQEYREITDELYDFGKMLLAENADRASKVDGKATNIVGYAGVILAFLVTRIPSWAPTMSAWPRRFVLFSTASVLVAIGCAFVAMLGRTWDWFSDEEWFKADALDHPSRLRRYHLTVMHRVNADHRRVNKRKTLWLMASQGFVAVSAASLAIALGLHILGLDSLPEGVRAMFSGGAHGPLGLGL
jgi:hypothetical protein